MDLIERLEEEERSPEMIALLEEADRRRRVANLLIVAGVGGMLAGVGLAQIMRTEATVVILVILMAAGYLTLIAGAAFYVKSKGYDWIVGGVGLLGVFGLLILPLLRDKIRNPVGR
ncbi:MAG: hypothetical protein ABI876_12915 [Bacteroidota bacterium]